MDESPSNQRAVRRHNLASCCGHVVEHGPRSRATIALETGLNKSTVSSLVSELIELGLLVERGAERRGTVGRRASWSRSRARASPRRAGGQRRLPGGPRVDLAGGVRHRALQAADNRAAGRRGGARPARRPGPRRAGASEAQGLRPVGATVALPGLVDAASGALLVAPNLTGATCRSSSCCASGSARGAAAAADNEANLAALAELREGAGRGLATSSTSPARSASAPASCSAASCSAARRGSAASSAT